MSADTILYFPIGPRGRFIWVAPPGAEIIDLVDGQLLEVRALARTRFGELSVRRIDNEGVKIATLGRDITYGTLWRSPDGAWRIEGDYTLWDEDDWLRYGVIAPTELRRDWRR